MDYWYNQYVLVNCKYNTQQAYSQIIKNHIKPSLGSYKLNALTPATLQEFTNDKFLHGFSKNFLEGILALLSGSLKYAVHPLGFIKDNPMQYVKRPKYNHTRTDTNRTVISQDDFKRIMERFPTGTTFNLPLLIGYHTGMRIGEVLALSWKDVDLDNQTISVNYNLINKGRVWFLSTPKTRSSIRQIKFGATLLLALKKHKKSQAENRLKYGKYYTQYAVVDGEIVKADDNNAQFVCTKENGDLVNHNTFRYCSRVIHFELNMRFNFHSLRHTHATMLIENGANIKDVQMRLGHSRIKTTLDTYTHATEKMANNTVDIFEKVVNLPTS